MSDERAGQRGLEAKAHDALLCEVVARHFPQARIDSDAHEVELGFGGLTIACRVDAIHQFGATKSASLFFYLRGGRLGALPVFASVSGYSDTAESAIITGACNWSCMFGPVLQAALAGGTSSEAKRFDIAIDGQAFRVFLDGLSRAFSRNGVDATDRIEAAYARLAPNAWLTRAVIESGRLPLLAADRPTVIGVFILDTSDNRVVEVKVDGCDWPRMEAAFAHAEAEPEGTGVLLRELAVAVPIGVAPPLTREPVVRTLRGLAERARITPASAASWPGAVHHGYVLAPPLPAAAIAALEERIGPLPADYRDFVASVGAFGGGPGYGLLSPLAEVQGTLARGSFDWSDQEEPNGPPGGVLCLAHAGCGVMWLLVVSGRHRGEVWVDASSSDRKAHRCAASFTDWYRDWLSTAVHDGRPWIQWDARCCAVLHMFSNVLYTIEREGITGEALSAEVAKRLEPGGIRLASGGSAYFGPETPLNPCEGCVVLTQQFSPRADLFEPGRELALGAAVERDASAATGAKAGWLARLRDKLTRS